jgi:dTMP kinase
VLCDRFADSTRVYQGVGGGVEKGMLDALDRIAMGPTRPDLTVILDVPASVGMARAAERLKAAGGPPDRFERDALSVHEARREAFLAIARDDPARCVVIDAQEPEEATAAAVWDAVATRLLDRAA